MARNTAIHVTESRNCKITLGHSDVLVEELDDL
ncbi:hypothetical protein SAMN05216226_111124 [Halovenus aranensis]|jgi:hypothetical protein|uniref:Uncharacterized protein n=1 Tax=Halovenus aranensis TaxID=890420 RepID=A0A1G8XM32_9EURY|nr:hypothetical protein SAMN05216226_111124 [Halovenus aranensis]